MTGERTEARLIWSDDIVATSDAAALIGVHHTTILKWMERHADFPAPVAYTGAGHIWLLSELAAWLEATGRPGIKPSAQRNGGPHAA